MCGRYVSVARLQELQEHYRATGAGDGTELVPSHNIAPTKEEDRAHTAQMWDRYVAALEKDHTSKH